MKNKVEKFELLKQITAMDFSIIDLHLYLNTHPMDNCALDKYNALVMECKMMKESYERFYGMLCMGSISYKYPWQWIEEPWPWEYDANFKL